MRLRFPFGLAVLGLVTSCLPQGEVAGPTRAPKLAAAVMLKKLDLDVPSDVAANLYALPIAADGTTVTNVVAAQPMYALAGTNSPDDATRAIECLTAAVYYEARSQSDDGQRAVAQVVLNRVRDRAFPNSVCGVVYQGSQRLTGCQFSFTCDGSMAAPRQPASWARAREIAVAALSGQVYAPVGSATFYHANYVNPWWASSMDKVAVVGAHIFYRWRGGMERALANSQGYAGYEPSLTGRVNIVRPDFAGVDVTGGAYGGGYGGGSYNDAQAVNGVIVHRGKIDEPKPQVAATDPAAPKAPTGKRIKVVADTGGVRVHRGGEVPEPADAE